MSTRHVAAEPAWRFPRSSFARRLPYKPGIQLIVALGAPVALVALAALIALVAFATLVALVAPMVPPTARLSDARRRAAQASQPVPQRPALAALIALVAFATLVALVAPMAPPTARLSDARRQPTRATTSLARVYISATSSQVLTLSERIHLTRGMATHKTAIMHLRAAIHW